MSLGRGGRLHREENDVRREEARVRERGERERGGEGRSREGRGGGGGGEGRRSGSLGVSDRGGGGHILWKSLSSAFDTGVGDISKALTSAEFSVDLKGRGLRQTTRGSEHPDSGKKDEGRGGRSHRHGGRLWLMAGEVHRMQRSLLRLQRRSENNQMRERHQRDEDDRELAQGPL